MGLPSDFCYWRFSDNAPVPIRVSYIIGLKMSILECNLDAKEDVAARGYAAWRKSDFYRGIKGSKKTVKK